MKTEPAVIACDALLSEAKVDLYAMHAIFCMKIREPQERQILTRTLYVPSKQNACTLIPIEKNSINKKHRSWQCYMESKDKN